ncbi:MAG TPA: hypothetical protein VIL34_09415 [Actinopolymorphaceae bacterium]|jgi:hypothetical protein
MAVKYDIGEIKCYSATLLELRDDGSLSSYVRDSTELDLIDRGVRYALLSLVADPHERIVSSVRKTVERVEEILYHSWRELDDAAMQYEQCEKGNENIVGRVWTRAEMERADESIGPVKRPPEGNHGLRTGPEAYSWGKTGLARIYNIEPRPSRHLVPPRNILDPDPGATKAIAGVLDLVSISAWAFEIVKMLTGKDVPQMVSQFLGGNWEAFGKCADALRRVGLAVKDLGHYVWKGNQLLDCTWGGNAADLCFAYHHRLAKSLERLQEPLDKLSNAYVAVARAVEQHTAALADALKMLIDEAIAAALSTASPVVAAGIAMTVEGRLMKWVARIQYIIGIMREAASQALVGVGAAVAVLNQFLQQFPPSDNYANMVRGRG